MAKLENRVAVITARSSETGLATAAEFVTEGAHVFIMERRKRQLDQAVALMGRGVTAVQGDVSNTADLDRLYARVAEEKGRVDIVFTEAGTGIPSPIGQITEQDFHQIFSVNLRGLLFGIQKALPLMPDGGVLLLCGSNASEKCIPGYSTYNAMAAAIRSFARTWTLDLKERKIRVNAISPGPIETPILGSLPKEVSDQLKSQVLSMVPANEFGHVEDIAKAASFLASNEGSYIRGVELFVDGGMACS